MKVLKNISTIISAIFTIALFLFVIAMQIQPETTSSFVGYQFYTVLTDSMEPVIPTYSLVLSKILDPQDEVKPGEIVTFRADRFGKEMIFTHYLKQTETGEDGITYYRTQGADAPHYDNYQTTREDLIGTYVFHIPYLGKIFLFLKSKYGLILAGELLVIWLVNITIKTRWKEKGQGIKEKQQPSS